MNKKQWLFCPICKGKTRTQIYSNTTLINFPLYCPKCKQEFLIEIKKLKMTIIKESDAKTQSR